MLVQLAVKPLARWLRHSRALDPKLLLLLFTLPFSKHLRFYLNAGSNGQFFNSLLGELRDRSSEAQHHRASDKLVVATIILWMFPSRSPRPNRRSTRNRRSAILLLSGIRRLLDYLKAR